MTYFRPKEYGPGRGFMNIWEAIQPARIHNAASPELRVDFKKPVQETGDYPIACAVSNVELEACKLLIGYGADVNAIRPNKGNALAYAVRALRQPHVKQTPERDQKICEICDLLLAHGCDPHPDTRHTALELAVGFGRRDLVENFMSWIDGNSAAPKDLYRYNAQGRLEAGADANLAGPMRHAIAYGVQDVVLRLIQLGADDSAIEDPAPTMNCRLTPFQAAVSKGWEEVVAYYGTERGEDIGQRTENGRTLLQLAITPGMRQLLRSLKSGAAIARSVESGVADGQPGKVSPSAAAKTQKRFSPL